MRPMVESMSVRPAGFCNLSGDATFNVTPGFSGTASIHLATSTAFGCPSLSRPFTVMS